MLDPAARVVQQLRRKKISDQGRAEKGKTLPSKPQTAVTVSKTLQPVLWPRGQAAQHGWGPSAQALFPPQARGMLRKPVPWPSASSCGTGRTSHPLCRCCLQTPRARGCSPFAARGQQPISAGHGSGAASSGCCSPSGTPAPRLGERCPLSPHLFPPQQNLSAFTDQPAVPEHGCSLHTPACCVVSPAWPSQQTRATAAGAREQREALPVI